MLKKSLLTVALLALVAAAQAQPVQATQAKKDLIARVLKLQQPGIEALATSLAEEPAAELMTRASSALPGRIPADKQEAVAKDIQGDLQKYAQEAVPLVRDRALKVAPASVGTLLDEKFSEDELRQVLAILESPAYVKYQQLGGEMQRVLTEALVADTRASVEPKVRALEQSIARRLGVTAGASAPAAAPAAAQQPAAASKPPVKK